MFEKIGEKLSAMVAIPTVSGNRNRTDYHIGEYREYLQTAFPCLFAAAVPTPVGEALLLKIEGRGEKKLPVLFTGHMDVVPADDASAWRYPPFPVNRRRLCMGKRIAGYEGASVRPSVRF